MKSKTDGKEQRVPDTIAGRTKIVRKQLSRIENCFADLTEPDKLTSERIFLESKMEILILAHERLLEALEDLETKHVAQRKFERLEHEHSDALKRLNKKIADLKEEGQSLISLQRLLQDEVVRSHMVRNHVQVEDPIHQP